MANLRCNVAFVNRVIVNGLSTLRVPLILGVLSAGASTSQAAALPATGQGARPVDAKRNDNVIAIWYSGFDEEIEIHASTCPRYPEHAHQA